MRPFKQLLLSRAGRLAGPFFHPWEKTGRMVKGTGNFIGSVGGTPPLEPYGLEEGWTQEGPREFHWNAPTTKSFPSLIFLIVPGETYRITGEVTVFEGTGGHSIKIRLGDNNNLFSINSTGPFDETGVAGMDNDELKFRIVENTSMTRVVLENIDYYVV